MDGVKNMKAYFALLFLILAACQSSVPSSSITTSAVNDLQGITKSIELIEKTTTTECKTDFLMLNLETLKARVESVEGKVKSIDLTCATEKKVLEEKITVRNVIIVSMGLIFALLLFILIRRKL